MHNYCMYLIYLEMYYFIYFNVSLILFRDVLFSKHTCYSLLHFFLFSILVLVLYSYID